MGVTHVEQEGRSAGWVTAAGAFLLAFGCAGASVAEERSEECVALSPQCVPVGHVNLSVALGAGVRTNPLVNGKDIPLVVIPQFSYYGKRFFIDNLDVGVTVMETGPHTVSLIATPGYDRVYFFRSDLQNIFVATSPFATNKPVYVTADAPGAIKAAPRSPKVTYLAGIEWTFKTGRLTGQLDLLRDATGQNDGSEIRAAVAAPLLESTGTLSAGIGFTWKSAGTVNYYYGVPMLYTGSAAFDPFVKVGYTHPLSSKWRFNAFIEYEHLGNAIADSPVVAERGVATAFVGTAYRF